jgi:hypothetical protein
VSRVFPTVVHLSRKKRPLAHGDEEDVPEVMSHPVRKRSRFEGVLKAQCTSYSSHL